MSDLTFRSARAELRPWMQLGKSIPKDSKAVDPAKEAISLARGWAELHFNLLKRVTDDLKPAYVQRICFNVCNDSARFADKAEIKRVLAYHVDRLETTAIRLREQEKIIFKAEDPLAAQMVKIMVTEIQEVVIWIDEVKEAAMEGTHVLIEKMQNKEMLFQSEM
ncbi:hypothetical protein FA15DRAFT_709872 [Coprinopsis marcescibilis]|uniref:Uncharacterized protein n=1 Tax=Coprinopsis marcescibilis TaxID=230819 RepID=A0A5C3KE86_COPMA|nr:hypothetical protein FA15DRAFT_709872 [Coprinopsis marcescibilis]